MLTPFIFVVTKRGGSSVSNCFVMPWNMNSSFVSNPLRRFISKITFHAASSDHKAGVNAMLPDSSIERRRLVMIFPVASFRTTEATDHLVVVLFVDLKRSLHTQSFMVPPIFQPRSEERRVGKECRSR